MHKLTKLCTALALAIGMTSAQADILVSTSSISSGGLGYGYDGYGWTNFKNLLNTAAGNQIATTTNFENLTQMLQYDSIMLDQRWTSGSLSASEISNISSFINTGRRALLIGENSSWTSWNQQILGIVGGSMSSSGDLTANLTPVVSNALTAGVSQVFVIAGATAVGGTSLFNQNVATLWGSHDNVLTVLDINMFDNSYGQQANNAVFATNVANW